VSSPLFWNQHHTAVKMQQGKFVNAALFFRVLRPWMKESLGDMLDDDPEKKIHF
jgi:hypothetical protein